MACDLLVVCSAQPIFLSWEEKLTEGKPILSSFEKGGIK